MMRKFTFTASSSTCRSILTGNSMCRTHGNIYPKWKTYVKLNVLLAGPLDVKQGPFKDSIFKW